MPAGLKTARASPVHPPVGAVNTWRGLPAARSQRVIVSPRITVASWAPPGCQATELTIFASESSGVVPQHGGLATGGGVPEPHRAVPGRGGHPRAVGTEGHVVDEAPVPAEDPVPLSQLHDPRHATRRRPSATPGVSRCAANATPTTSARWPSKTAIRSPGIGVPEPQLPIGRGGHDAPTVGGEDRVPEPIGVTAEHGDVLAVLCRPTAGRSGRGSPRRGAGRPG